MFIAEQKRNDVIKKMAPCGVETVVVDLKSLGRLRVAVLFIELGGQGAQKSTFTSLRWEKATAPRTAPRPRTQALHVTNVVLVVLLRSRFSEGTRGYRRVQFFQNTGNQETFIPVM